MKDVNEMIQEAREERLWGSIQVDFQDGQITVIRKTKTVKVQNEENNREFYPRNRR